MDTPVDVRNNLESLSRLLILAEPNDPQTLAQLHSYLESINDWALHAAQEGIAAAMRATADLVERIILEDEPNAEAAMERVNQTVANLQAVLLDELDANQAFPTVTTQGETAGLTAETETPFLDDAMLEYLSRQTNILDAFQKLSGQWGGPQHREATTHTGTLYQQLAAEAARMGHCDIALMCETAKEYCGQAEPDMLGEILGQVNDWLRQSFEAMAGVSDTPGSIEELMQAIQSRLAQNPAVVSQPASSDASPNAANSQAPVATPMPLEGDTSLLSDFVIEAREHLESADLNLLNLETNPSNEEALNALFRRFHTIKGVAGFIGLDDIRALAHETENLMDRARKHEITMAGGAIDAVFDSVDMLKQLVGDLQQSLASGQPLMPDPDCPGLVARIHRIVQGEPVEPTAREPRPTAKSSNKLGEILVEKGAVTREQLAEVLTEQQAPMPRRLGEMLVQDGYASAREVAHALREQQPSATQTPVLVRETVKVDAERLDQLVEMIGELVIAESMVNQSQELRSNASSVLLRHLSQLDKITRELQAMGTSLRMVPLRATFQKMARLVRDLSKKTGKAVNFVISGEDTELDKTVVEKIGDPLIHMVRNAIDHGLEHNAAARRQAGKPEVGRVELRAFHKGGNIYIEIEDDGRGLNRDAIQAKGIERGLIREGETLSDRELFNLIFNPGFSTAQTITDVSGRGVGMDVVKRNIDALRGNVDIRSEQGRGTVFTIRLPLTLAIIDGMVIRVGVERFIIPTLSIVRSIQPSTAQLSTVMGRGEMLAVQDQMLPLFRLDALFKLTGAVQDPTAGIVVIVEDAGRQIGLLTDELLGQQQIVIKSLGETMRGLPGLSGGAIMGDGQVGLILDVAGLINLAHQDEGNTTRQPQEVMNQ